MRWITAVLVLLAAGYGRAQGRVVRFTLRISGFCGDGGQTVATWCPVPGSGGEIRGGLHKEIRARLGDRVEITLINSSLWTPGRAAFTLTAAEVIENCNSEPFGGPKKLRPGEADKCRGFPQFGVNAVVSPGQTLTVAFAADKAGTYKYYDGLNRSGYGVFVVEP